MNNESAAKAKILILYLVSKAEGVTERMLMDKCLESLYTDYISYSQAFEELNASNFIEKNIERDGTGAIADSEEVIVSITPAGSAILDDLYASLNKNMIHYMDEASEDLKAKVDAFNSAKVKMEPEEGGFYSVIVTLSDDNGQYFSCRMRVDSKDKASALCRKLRREGKKCWNEFIKSFDING